MRITEFSVHNLPFMVVICLLLAAIGVQTWQNIPRSEDPHFPISAFQIIVLYPGADPAEIESQVVEPIEDAIAALDHIKHLSSTSDDSLGVVRVEFEAEVDVDKKYDEVTRELAALDADFPAGVASVEIQKINPGLVNIVQIALLSPDASWDTLEDAADLLKDRLERTAGVHEAEVWGVPARELRVELDLGRMAQLGIRPAEVLGAVGARDTNVPGGAVELGMRRFNLKTSGAYHDLQQLRETLVRGTGTDGVRIADIAHVDWARSPAEHVARLDGHRAVWVTANQKDGQNIFTTRAAIEATLETFDAQLPAGVQHVVAFDQSINVAHRLDRLAMDFLIAVGLVSLTLLPLGLRAAGVVMVSIPLSLLTGMAALYFTGFSLNQLSIAGFVVALGLLVDDSIVVTENIARFLRLGYSRTQAAIAATKQISLAVLGCTAALLLAFLPLLQLPDNAGKFIRSLPAAVSYTVLASLIISLTIIPFLASRVLSEHESTDGNRFLRALLRVIHGVYAPLLRRALARPRRTVGYSLLAVVASLALVPVIGLSLFPKADTPQFMIGVRLPTGASLAATDAVVSEVEAALREMPGVRHTMSNIGHGNPQVFYNVFPREFGANIADVFVSLQRFDGERTRHALDTLRARLDAIPGAEIVVKEFENGPPIAAPIAIRAVGPDLDTLRAIAGAVEDVMQTTPGVRDVVNPLRRARIDLSLGVDSTRAGLLGVATQELDQTVRLAVAGVSAGEFRERDGDSYPIILRAPTDDRPTLRTLDGLHIGTASGAQVPLTLLTRPTLVESPTQIDRQERERAVTLTAYPVSGFNTEKVTRQILRTLAAREWPAGYVFEAAGEVEGRQDSFAGFGTAILVAAFGILAVLVLEFGSFKSTLIVATVIPLGVMGGILMLALTGNSLSFTAMVGFIALIGIEIKNSILLVDFTNQLRAQGKPLVEAVIEAGEIRFLPILLTSATAIGGLLPLATQSSGLYSPMAWVIIGGLLTSTLIGRLVTPVMYLLLPPAIAADQRPAAAAN